MRRLSSSSTGKALRKFREMRRLTGRDFAEKTGISQGHISELESGRRNLTPNLRDRIAEGMGINLDEFTLELEKITESFPPESAEESSSAVREDTLPYGYCSPTHPPADEYKELSRWMVQSLPRPDAWQLLRTLTDAAEAGDPKAARCAKALINILSEPPTS